MSTRNVFPDDTVDQRSTVESPPGETEAALIREGLDGQSVCPFCGVVTDGRETVCSKCTMENTAVSRRATKLRIGPWYVLQHRNPAAPGMKWETLLAFVRKGRIKPRSIVRGPTTYQLWRFAAHVKGLSREFGVCYSCGGSVERVAEVCSHCNRSQEPPAQPDILLDAVDGEPKSPVFKQVNPSDESATTSRDAEALRLGREQAQRELDEQRQQAQREMEARREQADRELQAGREAIEHERETLEQEKQAVAQSREAAHRALETFANEQDVVARQKEAIKAEQATLEQEKQAVAQSREAAHRALESFANEQGEVTRQKEAIKAEQATLERERVALEQQKAAAAAEQQLKIAAQNEAQLERERAALALEQQNAAAEQQRNIAAQNEAQLERERAALALEQQNAAAEQQRNIAAQNEAQLERERAALALEQQKAAAAAEQEQKAVALHQEHVERERAALANEREALAREKEAVSTAREQELFVLHQEQVELHHEQVERERAALALEREALARDKEAAAAAAQEIAALQAQEAAARHLELTEQNQAEMSREREALTRAKEAAMASAREAATLREQAVRDLVALREQLQQETAALREAAAAREAQLTQEVAALREAAEAAEAAKRERANAPGPVAPATAPAIEAPEAQNEQRSRPTEQGRAAASKEDSVWDMGETDATRFRPAASNPAPAPTGAPGAKPRPRDGFLSPKDLANAFKLHLGPPQEYDLAARHSEAAVPPAPVGDDILSSLGALAAPPKKRGGGRNFVIGLLVLLGAAGAAVAVSPDLRAIAGDLWSQAMGGGATRNAKAPVIPLNPYKSDLPDFPPAETPALAPTTLPATRPTNAVISPQGISTTGDAPATAEQMLAAKSLYDKARDARSRSDYAEAVRLLEQVHQLPRSTWPGDIDFDLAMNRKFLGQK